MHKSLLRISSNSWATFHIKDISLRYNTAVSCMIPIDPGKGASWVRHVPLYWWHIVLTVKDANGLSQNLPILLSWSVKIPKVGYIIEWWIKCQIMNVSMWLNGESLFVTEGASWHIKDSLLCIATSTSTVRIGAPWISFIHCTWVALLHSNSFKPLTTP